MYYNAAIGLLLLAPVVILIYGAFFRNIEKINEEPEPEDKTELIDDNDEPNWDIGETRVKVIHKKKAS